MKSVLSFIRDVIGVLIAALLFGAAFGVFLVMARDADEGHIEYTAEVYAASTVSFPPEDPAEEGVGRFEIYVEGEGEPPEWYDPDGPMAVEWNSATDNDVGDKYDKDINVTYKTTEPGCYFGWDGHTAAEWEMDLFARIIYLEFWGTSPECIEAGIDSVLCLCESGYFGQTLGEVLTARAENGARVYTTYDYLWSTSYDAEALSEIRGMCEERFANGPVWIAPFFQLHYYPSWAQPCYEIDGVYFSAFKH